MLLLLITKLNTMDFDRKTCYLIQGSAYDAGIENGWYFVVRFYVSLYVSLNTNLGEHLASKFHLDSDFTWLYKS